MHGYDPCPVLMAVLRYMSGTQLSAQRSARAERLELIAAPLAAGETRDPTGDGRGARALRQRSPAHGPAAASSRRNAAFPLGLAGDLDLDLRASSEQRARGRRELVGLEWLRHRDVGSVPRRLVVRPPVEGAAERITGVEARAARAATATPPSRRRWRSTTSRSRPPAAIAAIASATLGAGATSWPASSSEATTGPRRPHRDARRRCLH